MSGERVALVPVGGRGPARSRLRVGPLLKDAAGNLVDAPFEAALRGAAAAQQTADPPARRIRPPGVI